LAPQPADRTPIDGSGHSRDSIRRHYVLARSTFRSWAAFASSFFHQFFRDRPGVILRSLEARRAKTRRWLSAENFVMIQIEGFEELFCREEELNCQFQSRATC